MKEYKLLRIFATALVILLILFDPVEKLMAHPVATKTLKGHEVGNHIYAVCLPQAIGMTNP